MRVFTYIWTTVTTVTQWLTLSPFGEDAYSQVPIGADLHLGSANVVGQQAQPGLFRPPGSNIAGFQCDYSAMGPDWVDCTSIPGCWLLNTKTREQFNVTIDYETSAPIGIRRNYTLNVTDGKWNADGKWFLDAKLFNNSFPGPLIEACWGDSVNITVFNNLKFNGTSIHWHGIRQNQTMHMDGVNGITQCPIAPKDSFSYIWNVTQYGSSWYHSHYSVQYADGLQGPITLHGPTSITYNDSVAPLLTGDWLHFGAFASQYDTTLDTPTILLNGTGNVTRFYGLPPDQGLSVPKGLEITFNGTITDPRTGARRYLLRVINTSYSTEITFSIDNHYLLVVEADFVPVAAKNVTSVLIAIGQRYHLVVEAKPFGGPQNPLPFASNYWIRTNVSGCHPDDVDVSKGSGVKFGFERTGILRYDSSDQREPASLPWPNIPQNCNDTLSMTLQTMYNWTVTAPKNGISGQGEQFAVGINFSAQTQYSLGHFSLNRAGDPFAPFQTTYGNPTFLNLDSDIGSWPIGWMVVPENYTSTDFVYLVLEGSGHPIHLHGHDFAILDMQSKPYVPGPFRPPYQSPMRRDVVLLPPGGYAVIAFKTDNPGAWLMHCHIAFHASGGLSLQIMERQSKANEIWPPGNSSALKAARRVCNNWNDWAYDCRNYWPQQLNDGSYPSCLNATALQNDSGV